MIEDPIATQKYEDFEDEIPAELYLWTGIVTGSMVAANLFIPIFSPILVGVLGIWLIRGRMGIWKRMFFTFTLTFLLSLGGAYALLFLFAVLLLVAIGTLVVSFTISANVQASDRKHQLSLWEIGAIITGLGFLFGIFRGIQESQVFAYAPAGRFLEIVLQATAVSTNVVLGSLIVFVPERYRSARWFYVSALSILVVLPLVEILVLAYFGWSRGMFILIAMMHAGGALALWSIIYPLEFAGMFRE